MSDPLNIIDTARWQLSITFYPKKQSKHLEFTTGNVFGKNKKKIHSDVTKYCCVGSMSQSNLSLVS